MEDYFPMEIIGRNMLLLQKNPKNINDSGIENLGTDWMLKQMGEGNFKFSRRWAWLYRHYIWASRVPSLKDRRAVVLDVGCDVGEIRKIISKSFYTKNPDYIGIDLQGKGLREGAEQIQMKVPAYYIQHDITTGMEFINDNSIDVIYAGEIIEHFEEKFGKVLLEEAFRVLVPGGRLLVSTPNLDNSKGYDFHVHEYKIPELRKAFEDVGFSIDKTWGWIGTEKTILKSHNTKAKMIYKFLKKYSNKDLFTPIIIHIDPELSDAFCLEGIKPN